MKFYHPRLGKYIEITDKEDKEIRKIQDEENEKGPITFHEAYDHYEMRTNKENLRFYA